MNFSNLIYALLSGILPALLWLWFWLQEDNLHREPRILITKVFISGAIMVIFAIVLEKIVADLILNDNLRYFYWAIIEEILKFFAVAVIVFHSNRMDEPIDAMIYCITASLGFAALENAFFIFSSLEQGKIIETIITGNMRFIGATLVHVISSASIGFMIGISFYKNKFIRLFSVLIGVILAVVLHTSFNLSIINTTAMETLKVFGWVWCAIIILLILFEEIKKIKPKEI